MLYQYQTVFWSTVIVALVSIFGWWLGRKLQKYPGRRQAAAELLVGWFDTLCKDMLGRNRGRKYLPIFGSLFMFVCACNVIGVVPLSGLTAGLFPRNGLEIAGEGYRDSNGDGAWQPGEPVVRGDRTDWDATDRRMGFLIPPLAEPTRNVNVPIGLSLFLATGMYGAAVVLKGPKGLARSFVEPLWFMLPLNLIGAVAQVVSVSFRLFGNIFGGSVIMIVAIPVVYDLLPRVLENVLHGAVGVIGGGFLGLFVGTIQAFVFTMLWMAYHADLVAEEQRA